MERQVGRHKHKYRLVLSDDMKGCAQRIELDAPDALRAMSLVQRSLCGREIELYEDDKPLGRLWCNSDGFWTVLPSARMGT